MKLAVITLFSVFAIALSASAWASQPLLTPQELSHISDAANVQVVDIRPAKAYAAGHIPGAVSAPYPQWRGPADNPGKLPSKQELTSLVRRLGLDNDIHAVVVTAGTGATNFGAAARVYWTLKYVGLDDLSILNGGFKSWVDAGLPQSRAVPKVTPTDYVVHFDQSIVAKTAAVAAQVGNPQTRLVDARPHKYYLGDVKAPTVKVAGTIKGAINVEEGKWFKPGTGVFVSKAKAEKIASKALKKPADETISFCNTGHWAATDWFALSEIAGVKNVRLYPESLTAWTRDSKLPMQNVPSRSQQLLRKVKSLFD